MDSEAPSYPPMVTNHLVKGEDLNHHHSLYAGRCAEWSVQMAYVTAQACFAEPRPLVFMSIRSMSMRSPARLGDILHLTGRVDYVGESTIGIRVDGRILQPPEDGRVVVTGKFLFCTVDDKGQAEAHGLPALTDISAGSKNGWQKCEAETSRTP